MATSLGRVPGSVEDCVGTRKGEVSIRPAVTGRPVPLWVPDGDFGAAVKGALRRPSAALDCC